VSLKIYAVACIVISALFCVYPVLHVLTVYQMFRDASAPSDWPVNLGIAMLAGLAGYMLARHAWHISRRAFKAVA